MNSQRRFAKLLLWTHLLVCLVWLYLFNPASEPSGWMVHVAVWSILAIQFTWGFTVGLIVGPNRRRRSYLWWSLLTVFLPLYFISPLFVALTFAFGLPLALVYLAIFVMILACETWGGVMLGAKMHNSSSE